MTPLAPLQAFGAGFFLVVMAFAVGILVLWLVVTVVMFNDSAEEDANDGAE